MFTRKFKNVLAFSLLFYVVSSPFTDRFVNSVIEPLTFVKTAEASCPTQAGLVVHTAVFALVCYYVLCAL
jgi:hypothetical protein